MGIPLLRQTAWVILALACCLVLPLQAQAQSAYAGVYSGSFFGGGDSGQLAILVRPNGQAVLLAFDNLDEDGFAAEGLTVAANGAISASDIDGAGTSLSGSFTPTGVSGSFARAGGGTASFSAVKAPAQGDLRALGGYYRGPLDGDVFVNGQNRGDFAGTLHMILSAHGLSYAVFEGQVTVDGTTEPVEAGDQQTGNTAANICESVALDGVNFTCQFNASLFRFSGSYDISDGPISVVGTWSLTRIFGLPNRAPRAVADAYSLRSNGELTVTAAQGVLANDSDPDGDGLTAARESGPSDGTLTLRADGGFTYRPDPGFAGTDGFTYRATDGSLTDTASVTLTVEEVIALPWLGLLIE